MRPGFTGRQFASAIAFAAALAGVHLQAADLSFPVTGNLLGTVVDSEGAPQMGASVQIFNKYQHLLARTWTAPDGRFAFVGLPADLYSVRVVAASFLPASRDGIAVKPGIDGFLRIHLATLLSSVELNYKVPTGAMSEDWKWVLRSAPATRPVNRILEESSGRRGLRPSVFSQTHAMLAVTGGDSGLIDQDELSSDVGTVFAFSTSLLLDKNQLQVAGTLGQNTSPGPAAMALCAIYSRSDSGPLAAAPELTYSIAQIGGLGSQLGSPNGTSLTATGVPALRTMAMSLYETADPLDNVHLEYGITSESVDFVQHANRLSPFGRLTIDLGTAGEVVAAYSDGGRPDPLTAHQELRANEAGSPSSDLASPLESLSRLPQVSDRNGHLELQRTENYEIGYRKSSGSQTYAFSAFSEHVSNGRLNLSGDLDGLPAGDLFSDGISTLSTYNIGSYSRLGYLASVNQRVNDNFGVGMAYGRLGGFTLNPGAFNATGLSTDSKFLQEKNLNLASLNVKTTLPGAGTRISANYGWADPRVLIPRHTFNTQDVVDTPGFNIMIRQPLPSMFGLPGRLEITADLRNLLAQGYVPVAMAGGRQLVAVEAPRAIRGGLKFIF